MNATVAMDNKAQALVEAALQGRLTEAQAEQLAKHLAGSEPALVKFVLLAVVGRIAELSAELEASRTPDPSTPSGQVPIYTKPNISKRGRRPGAKPGHEGTRRTRPQEIRRREEHRLERCPVCGGELQRCGQTRRRIIEDIPEDIRVEATEHTIHRDWCPRCKKHVEPAVPDALPKATLGHRAVALTAWLHYGLGVTIDQIVDVLSFHLHTKLSRGGLVAAWQRLATLLQEWYEQIAREALLSAVLHADETGWRVNGQGYWLWCFANRRCCYYMIDRCRGSPALEKFFTDCFDGTLVTDFWAAYDLVAPGDRQCCLAHLLRELERVDRTNVSAEWQAFAKMVRRLVRDGIRLRKRPDFSPERYRSRILLIDRRLMKLAEARYTDPDAERLAARLLKYCDQLFTFLDRPEVPYDNNLAERMLRPAVLLRKASQSNRSEKGAATQAILMSISRTLKLRGHHPVDTLVSALKTYVATGQLPPLPPPATTDG
jgi:transposase